MTDEADKVTAERLTLISHVDRHEVDEPVFVQARERYWLDRSAGCLVIEDTLGKRRSIPAAWPGGPVAPR